LPSTSRNFSALLTLIGAHALLHRDSRDRDESGAIIATTADYATVRELMADVFAEGIEATVPATVRETVDAHSALNNHEVFLVTPRRSSLWRRSVSSGRRRKAIDRANVDNR
jgi:hypothetical protein